MKTIKLLSLAICSNLLLAIPALADQCAYITKEQALIAVSRLNVGQTIYKLCEPSLLCVSVPLGETKIKQP